MNQQTKSINQAHELLQDTASNTAKDTSNHRGSFLKANHNNSCANGECSTLTILVLQKTSSLLVSRKFSEDGKAINGGSVTIPQQRKAKEGNWLINHTFFSYTLGSTVAAALGATNKAISCLLRTFSASMLHPHMKQPVPTQRPESHINGVTVFASNIFGPSLVRARQTP